MFERARLAPVVYTLQFVSVTEYWLEYGKTNARSVHLLLMENSV